MCQFSGKTGNFDFFGPNFPQNGFRSWNFKNLSPDSKLAPRYHVRQFSVKMNNFESFGLNLGKSPIYVRYLGSNNVEGIAERWIAAEMRWVEMDGAEWRWMHCSVIPIIILLSFYHNFQAFNWLTDLRNWLLYIVFSEISIYRIH